MPTPESMNIVGLRKGLADALNRVKYRGERIVLERRGKGVAALVTMDDLELLRRMEDEYWSEAALKAEAKMKGSRETPIPWERAKRLLDAANRRNRPKKKGA